MYWFCAVVYVYWFLKIESWFSGRGWGQQLFSFQSPVVHWMARTSSLNCLYCRNPYQPPIHWIAAPLFTENPFFSRKSASSHPLPKNRLWLLFPRKKCSSWCRGRNRIIQLRSCWKFPCKRSCAKLKLAIAIGSENFTWFISEISSRNSVRANKLTELRCLKACSPKPYSGRFR